MSPGPRGCPWTPDPDSWGSSGTSPQVSPSTLTRPLFWQTEDWKAGVLGRVSRALRVNTAWKWLGNARPGLLAPGGDRGGAGEAQVFPPKMAYDSKQEEVPEGTPRGGSTGKRAPVCGRLGWCGKEPQSSLGVEDRAL